MLDDRVDDRIKSATSGLVTHSEAATIKDYLAKLDKEISTIEGRIDLKFAGLDPKFVKLEGDIAAMENRLISKIGNAKVDMIKWFVAFFFAVITMIIGLDFK